MDTVTRSSAADSVRAPFGSWPMDRVFDDISPSIRHFYVTSIHTIGVFEDKYFVKLYEDAPESLQHELTMMLLAGDCAVAPVGRVFKEEKLYGFITAYESAVAPLDPSDAYFGLSLVPPDLSRSDRLKIIDQLSVLVSRLHQRGIIHGDIKPPNLLLCSDGALRFCDFGCAVLDGSGKTPPGLTSRYCSPYLLMTFAPLTKAEDRYSTGISIWEIYTGRIPFDQAIDEELVDDIIRAGVRPDISLVDDPAVGKLVSEYLDSGDRSSDEKVFPQPREVCIASPFTFQACMASPAHTYCKIARCEECVKNSPEACPNLYTVPTSTPSNLICTQCRPIVYQGI